MCIAIYSPKGVDVPCEEYLKNSFINNPDGAGFAFNTNSNNVSIEKGFMDWKSFWKAFSKANRKFNFKDRGVLIHFRIATHGGTNPGCCHPFPLVSDIATMRKTKVKSDYAVIHNGIIDITSLEAYERKKASDTMVFIEKYLSKIATNKKWFKNKVNFELIYDMIDSKMAILNGYGDIQSTAGFVKDNDGNFYSNTTYKEDRNWVRNFMGGYLLDPIHPYSSDNTEKGSPNCDSDVTALRKAINEMPSAENSSYTSEVAIMKLDSGQVACIDNFEELEYDDIDFDIFMTEYGEIFVGEKNEAGEWLFEYLGDGDFFDIKHGYTSIEFVPDFYVSETWLYD